MLLYETQAEERVQRDRAMSNREAIFIGSGYVAEHALGKKASMTVGYCPAFDPKLPAPFLGDGAALFHHAAVLDAIAEERGLPLLTSFADDREPPPDFDGYPEELAEALGPWTAWFSTTEGL